MPRRRSKRWRQRGGGTVIRALLLLAAVGCCLAAAAYAASGPDDAAEGQRGSRPLVPRLTDHPDSVTTETVARFDFAARPRPASRAKPGHPLDFQCRLDDDAWDACRAPVPVDGLRDGHHRFQVRAINRGGRPGEPAVFDWRVLRAVPPAPHPPAPQATPAAGTPAVPAPDEREPGLPFSIEQLEPPPPLFPGTPAQPLAVRLDNPNPLPIAITSLRVSLAADPSGCAGAENFVFIPSDASAATPLAIPPEASVTLPAQGISPPAIAMRDLPVSQDACQGAELQLLFSGEAHG